MTEEFAIAADEIAVMSTDWLAELIDTDEAWDQFKLVFSYAVLGHDNARLTAESRKLWSIIVEQQQYIMEKNK